jgi:ABC-2 type transport system permease protein
MGRVIVIAQNEFLALARSKFFLIGILSMPLLMGVLFGFISYAEHQIDREDRKFAVVDLTGVLYDEVARAAAKFNEESDKDGRRTGPRFLPSVVDVGGRSLDDVKVDLSERVRRKDVFAFVEVPASALDPKSKEPIHYYSQQTGYQRLSSWLRTSVNEAIEKQRLRQAGVDPAMVSKLTAKAELSTFGLVERLPDGHSSPAKKIDGIERFGVPFFFLIVMFMTVLSNAQHLINTIIEEKMTKISEVLLGSVTAFQLLMGKLLGIVAVSFVLAFVYLAGGVYAVVSLGRVDVINPALIGWFLLFLVCASLMFGSIFQALSSACSDLKDAQSMLQPAMMVLIAAYVSSFVVVRAPDSALAVALSFVPAVSPFAMLLRLAMPPGPPVWQVLLSAAILVSSTAIVVWAAGRVFRVGLLMQGKPPNLPELMRWIRASGSARGRRGSAGSPRPELVVPRHGSGRP